MVERKGVMVFENWRSYEIGVKKNWTFTINALWSIFFIVIAVLVPCGPKTNINDEVTVVIAGFLGFMLPELVDIVYYGQRNQITWNIYHDVYGNNTRYQEQFFYKFPVFPACYKFTQLWMCCFIPVVGMRYCFVVMTRLVNL